MRIVTLSTFALQMYLMPNWRLQKGRKGKFSVIYIYIYLAHSKVTNFISVVNKVDRDD